MANLIYGERIGQTANLRLGCCAVLFNQNRDKILLTRRSDNGEWCLPSGGVEPGESIAETCEREMLEESGLTVTVKRIIGIYSNPNVIVQYEDLNKFQIVSVSFEVEYVSGDLITNSEVTALDFFSKEEIKNLKILNNHKERIEDAFNDLETPRIA